MHRRRETCIIPWGAFVEMETMLNFVFKKLFHNFTFLLTLDILLLSAYFVIVAVSAQQLTAFRWGSLQESFLQLTAKSCRDFTPCKLPLESFSWFFTSNPLNSHKKFLRAWSFYLHTSENSIKRLTRVMKNMEKIQNNKISWKLSDRNERCEGKRENFDWFNKNMKMLCDTIKILHCGESRGKLSHEQNTNPSDTPTTRRYEK